MEDGGTQVIESAPRDTRAFGHTTSVAARKFGYLVAIIVNLVMLYVFRHLAAWGAPIITEAWAQVLPALELSIGATVLAHLLYIFYDGRWFRRVMQIGLSLLSLRVVLSIYRVFPFGGAVAGLEGPMRIGLVVVMACIVIAMVAEAIHLLLGHE